MSAPSRSRSRSRFGLGSPPRTRKTTRRDAPATSTRSQCGTINDRRRGDPAFSSSEIPGGRFRPDPESSSVLSPRRARDRGGRPAAIRSRPMARRGNQPSIQADGTVFPILIRTIVFLARRDESGSATSVACVVMARHGQKTVAVRRAMSGVKRRARRSTNAHRYDWLPAKPREKYPHIPKKLAKKLQIVRNNP